MRIKLRTLHKIIQESISQAHFEKLQTLIESGNEATYNQAIELWETLDPGGCPYPPYEEFFGPKGEPHIIGIFSETKMAMEHPGFFREYCSAGWLSPRHELRFEFTFPFVCGDEDADYDFGMGQRYYVVPGTDVDVISDWIEQDMANEIMELSQGIGWEVFWDKWKSITVDVDDQTLEDLQNGFATVTVSYT